MSTRLLHGDCLKMMPLLPADSFDACACDPPYHLTSVVDRFGKEGAAPAKFGSDGAFARASVGFMGQQWDGGDIAMRPETWREVYRVLKPGAHLAAFGGTRTFHRMACAIEDAGFEIRDCLMWIYGTGFPKSHDVSKGIDKHLGAERVVLSEGTPVKRMIPGADQNGTGSWAKDDGREYVPQETAAGTPEAAQWDGWGTALKPAWEPIILARKPLIGTVAQNVLTYGTGGINIDGCRVDMSHEDRQYALDRVGGFNRTQSIGGSGILGGGETMDRAASYDPSKGRFPANVLHDGSDEVLAAFAQFGEKNGGHHPATRGAGGISTSGHGGQDNLAERHSDSGSASRFFYCAKANKSDRAGSKHPTVKPIALMRWLTRLVTPPGGLILDPFAGSGTTGEAARLEGFSAVLIEQSAEYVADIKRRLAKAA